METVDEFLEHHGIKGMKWGVRRKRGSDGRVKGGAAAKPKAKDLSDEELKKAVSRMNMERQYNTLIKQTSTSPKSKTVASFLAKHAGTIVTTAVTAFASKQVSNAINEAHTKAVAKAAAKKAAAKATGN